MKTSISHIIVFCLSLLYLNSFSLPLANGEEIVAASIRPSMLAGTWYPKSRDILTRDINSFLSKAKRAPIEGELKAIISPHAGYLYSGQVAAHAYGHLKGKKIKRVILVGPSHRVGFRGISVNLQSGYETPFGIVPVDRAMAKRIVRANPDFNWIKKAHAREHSLEIQLPFLQVVLDRFRIVPILMGQQDYSTCSKLSKVLSEVMMNSESTLLLASSDLSHYHSYDKARVLDRQFISRVRTFDHQGLSNDLSVGKCEACGGGPVVSILSTCMKIGADKSLILNYANSGDVTGDHRRVVGYLSAALIKASDKDQGLR